MYVKVFSKILDSSIWLEPHATRIVWLTFLATMDEHGFAQFAAVGNVARRAIVTLDEARAAIKTLESPDPDSSDPEHDGRRLERVPGGWMVLNATKHRALATRGAEQEANRLRAAKHRARKKVTLPDTQNVTRHGDVTDSVTSHGESNGAVTTTDTDTNTEANTETEAEADHCRLLGEDSSDARARENNIGRENAPPFGISPEAWARHRSRR